MPSIKVIASLDPYAEHRQAVIEHPLVNELRFNTITAAGEDKVALLRRLKRETRGKRLWIDLKCRQLRITQYAFWPYARVQLNHRVSVNLPTPILFKDCVARVVEIFHDQELVLAGATVRPVGDGEPVNILDPSLRIHGFFTRSDREYIAAAKANNLHDYMLSFAEQEADIAKMYRLDPRARVVAKIESRRGLALAERLARVRKPKNLSLMAACDDLYINMGEEKTDIFAALKTCRALPRAIAASRILTSLEKQDVPSMQDLMHLELLYRMGYRRFMLSDRLCYEERSFALAMKALADMLQRWQR